MEAEDDEYLAYGGDETREEKLDHEPPQSPPPESEDKDSILRPEERGAKKIIEACFEKERKAQEIIGACRRRDFEVLQALAETPGGFLSDELRQMACESAR